MNKISLVLIVALATTVSATFAQVTINTAFPGGNVLVQKNEGSTVEIAPDLRGGKPWFYWYFEAQSSQPGRATFVFAKPGAIGVRGPAISRDNGASWQWLGSDRVHTVPRAGAPEKTPPQETFDYEFTKAGERIRFSVGIPYVQSDLDRFLTSHAGNAHLTRSVLTQSRKGRAVEFLQIGEPGVDKRGVLLTARHHACEALASYVLEGFMQEALSESRAAVRFREKHVLYVVPFVDKDGVEDGDQGKNREPHDHNRDYGDAPIFPEIQAIQDWAARTPLQIALDLHCPALKGDIHEAFHFLGLGVPHVKNNLDEWIAWIGEERPPAVMSPLDLLIDPAKPNAINRAINSHYFATKEGVLLAATLESPYTQVKPALDADMARAYGAGLLKALNRLELVTAASDGPRAGGHAELLALREGFLKSYRGRPFDAEMLAKRYLDDRQADAALRNDAVNLLGLLRLNQGYYDEALGLAKAVLMAPDAMTSQTVLAHSQRLRALASLPATTPQYFQACLEAALRLPYPSHSQLATCYSTAADFYQSRRDFPRALDYMEKLFGVVPEYEKGKTLSRLASLLDADGQPDQALATRQRAIALLRQQLSPAPQRSIFGATLAVELFDITMALPASTREEKQSAADLVLHHDIVAAPIKERVRKAMDAAR